MSYREDEKKTCTNTTETPKHQYHTSTSYTVTPCDINFTYTTVYCLSTASRWQFTSAENAL